MQILYGFLSSDTWLVMQFVAIFGLVVFAFVFSAQVQTQQRILARENEELRNEVDGLTVRREQAVRRLADEQDRHRNLLAKIGDDIYDVHPLTPEDFDSVSKRDNSQPVRVSLDLSNSDEMMAPQPSNDSRFAQTDPRPEPTLMLATVSDISGHKLELEGPVDDRTDADSDPLTRALKISKAIRG